MEDWKDYLTTNQAAEALDIGESRVRQLVLDGVLPHKKMAVGKNHFLMIHKDDVEKAKSRKTQRGWPKGKPRSNVAHRSKKSG